MAMYPMPIPEPAPAAGRFVSQQPRPSSPPMIALYATPCCHYGPPAPIQYPRMAMPEPVHVHNESYETGYPELPRTPSRASSLTLAPSTEGPDKYEAWAKEGSYYAYPASQAWSSGGPWVDRQSYQDGMHTNPAPVPYELHKEYYKLEPSSWTTVKGAPPGPSPISSPRGILGMWRARLSTLYNPTLKERGPADAHVASSTQFRDEETRLLCFCC